MTLNYREETELEALLAGGVPETLAQECLEALHTKLEALDVTVDRFDGWTVKALRDFLGFQAGAAAWCLTRRDTGQ